METFIEELFVLDLSDFITDLIKQDILKRDRIHFANDENSGVEYWWLIDKYEIQDVTIFLEYNISYIEFGNEIFVGLGCDYDQLINDPDWNKFFKEYIQGTVE